MFLQQFYVFKFTRSTYRSHTRVSNHSQLTTSIAQASLMGVANKEAWSLYMKRAALYWVQATPQLLDAVEGNEYSSNQQEKSIFPHTFESCDQDEAAKFVFC